MSSCTEADGVYVLDTGSTDGTVERLRELGVKATKSLPNQLSDYDEEDERTEIETVTENEDKNGEESASVPNVR